MTSPGETPARALLDKPLYQLTEDDISQLTREDCRNYLKEKGMRRPSWNKSQAIQQVISLKTLFEPPEDAEAAEARKKLRIPRPEIPPPRAASFSRYPEKGKAADARVPVPAGKSVLNWRQKPPESHISGNISGRNVAAKGNTVSPRTIPTADEPVGQMTIFYCGKVNVYDDMPHCKAQAILKLAGSSVPVPQKNIVVQSTVPKSPPSHLWAAGFKVGTICPMVNPTPETVKLADKSPPLPRVESNSSHDDSLESPTCRKASVQRYLEKRKDRFKKKKSVVMPSSTSFDIFLNHQVGNQPSDAQFSWRELFASSQVRPPSFTSTLQLN